MVPDIPDFCHELLTALAEHSEGGLCTSANTPMKYTNVGQCGAKAAQVRLVLRHVGHHLRFCTGNPDTRKLIILRGLSLGIWPSTSSTFFASTIRSSSTPSILALLDASVSLASDAARTKNLQILLRIRATPSQRDDVVELKLLRGATVSALATVALKDVLSNLLRYTNEHDPGLRVDRPPPACA